MSEFTPHRIIINVNDYKGTAKGLMSHFRIEQTVTGVQIIIEPPLANFIAVPVLRNLRETAPEAP